MFLSSKQPSSPHYRHKFSIRRCSAEDGKRRIDETRRKELSVGVDGESNINLLVCLLLSHFKRGFFGFVFKKKSLTRRLKNAWSYWVDAFASQIVFILNARVIKFFLEKLNDHSEQTLVRRQQLRKGSRGRKNFSLNISKEDYSLSF